MRGTRRGSGPRNMTAMPARLRRATVASERGFTNCQPSDARTHSAVPPSAARHGATACLQAAPNRRIMVRVGAPPTCEWQRASTSAIHIRHTTAERMQGKIGAPCASGSHPAGSRYRSRTRPRRWVQARFAHNRIDASPDSMLAASQSVHMPADCPHTTSAEARL